MRVCLHDVSLNQRAELRIHSGTSVKKVGEDSRDIHKGIWKTRCPVTPKATLIVVFLLQPYFRPYVSPLQEYFRAYTDRYVYGVKGGWI